MLCMFHWVVLTHKVCWGMASLKYIINKFFKKVYILRQLKHQSKTLLSIISYKCFSTMFSFVVKQPSPKMFVFGVNYFGKYIYDISKKSFLRDNYNHGFQHVFYLSFNFSVSSYGAVMFDTRYWLERLYKLATA